MDKPAMDWAEQTAIGCISDGMGDADTIRRVAEALRGEREACARIVEKMSGADAVYPEGIRMIADAIRARSD